MPTIEAIQPETAQGEAKEILNGIQSKVGMVPNLYKSMATSPAALKAILTAKGALNGGDLSAQIRELIALTVSEINQCHYCLSAHSTIASSLGLSEEEITESRKAISKDPKTHAILDLARKITETQANISQADIQSAKDAGLSDGEITEVIANVVVNIWTNYFNHIADPEIDFPVAEPLEG